jgi:DNA-binding CsgD family transcriptional regulator/tetratricopeptide (TPR) repeat protein
MASAAVLQPRNPPGWGTSLTSAAPPPARRQLTGLQERDRELQQLQGLLATASFGAGQVVLVEGEAGVGKTSLLRAFLASLPPDAAVWQGRCDPLATPRPFAPLHDIAAVTGGPLGSLLENEAPPFDVSRAMLEGLRAPGSTRVVVIEDIHWADCASLDLVRFLGRRLDELRAVLVLTYRTEQLRSDDPTLVAVGDLSSLPWASRITLSGLSKRAVAVLTSGTPLDPDEVHRVTGGNAFYVTEVLSTPDGSIPATVRDAVLARAATLSPAGRSTLETASVLGSRVDANVLVALGEMSGADECIAAGVLVEHEGALGFRHELARQVILDSILPGRRMKLAAAVLAELTSGPAGVADMARLAALADEAGDAVSSLRYATGAASHAAAMGAHREAAAQYRRALRHAGGLTPPDRALLFEQLSYESYLTDRVPEALAARRQALAIRRELGDRTMQGEDTRWLSRLHWMDSDAGAAERAGMAALKLLEPLGTSAPLAWAYSNLSQLRMLGNRSREAIELGERAIAAGHGADDPVVAVHALNNIGVARLLSGVDQGWSDLGASLWMALEAGHEEHAARAYVNLYCFQLDRLRLVSAEATFHDASDYVGERDLDTWRWHLLGSRCQHLLLTGDWPGAGAVCAEIERGWLVSPIARVAPLAVLGTLRARRGDPDVAPPLEEALRLASVTNELQRLGPALIASGEASWLRGDTGAAAAAFLRVRDLAADREVWWWSRACAWLMRIGHPAAGTGEGAVGPYRLELAGQHQAAAAEWARLGCPYQEALALARTGPAGRRRALALLEGLGARVTVAVVSRDLRASGARALPRGPLRATRANPFGLTAREVDVCDLLRRGLRNAEIARRLHLAPRTIEHYVASILAKTDARSRTEAAAIFSDQVAAGRAYENTVVPP